MHWVFEFDRLDSIDRWLAPLRLRDLSDLTGDPVAFYEGLLDLQPDSTMSLNPSRRVVLVTALDTIDLADWAGPIGPSQIRTVPRTEPSVRQRPSWMR